MGQKDHAHVLWAVLLAAVAAVLIASGTGYGFVMGGVFAVFAAGQVVMWLAS